MELEALLFQAPSGAYHW